MDTIMAVQEHVALARSLFDQLNNRHSDPAWLDKCMAAFAADAEDVDVPSGTTLHGPDGHRRRSDLSSPLLLLNEEPGGEFLPGAFCLQDGCFA